MSFSRLLTRWLPGYFFVFVSVWDILLLFYWVATFPKRSFASVSNKYIKSFRRNSEKCCFSVTSSPSGNNLFDSSCQSPATARRHSSYSPTSHPGELNVEYYPLTHLPVAGEQNGPQNGGTGEWSSHSPGGRLSPSGALLEVKDLSNMYIRRHSWDSRRTRQPKTMPNIKIW